MSTFTLERVSGPVVEAISLAEAKLHLRIDPLLTEFDTEIAESIQAAREWAEAYTGRVLIDSVWRMSVGDFAPRDLVTDAVQGNATSVLINSVNGVLLRRSPIIELGSIVSIGTDGALTEVQDVGSPSVGLFEVRDAATKWPRLVGLSGAPTLSSGNYTIEFRAGFAAGQGSPLTDPDVSLVPAIFKRAMKLWISADYDQDERMMNMLFERAEQSIKPERAELQMA